ncbi:hypothetical protein C8F01DRAFT_1121183 [Mycena amicta]|nr:hypothetical protein C8F01DRAFT_1121183 [Mycena amicta]
MQLYLPPLPRVPPTPCSELLRSNAAPTDPQVSVICDAIETAEARKLWLDAEIERMESALQPFRLRRQELERFAHSHRGVVSSLRRVPNEILGEIFQKAGGDPHSDILPLFCILRSVCRHWHETSPLLLQHLAVRDNLKFPARYISSIHGPDILLPRETKRIEFQLRHSHRGPLTLDLTALPGIASRWSSNFYFDRDGAMRGLLDLLLLHSTRWQKLSLIVNPTMDHLIQSGRSFPALKSLDMIIEQVPADLDRFFHALPALTHLTWNNCSVANPIDDIPWSRLQTCELIGVQPEQILRILPRLASGCRLTLGWLFGCWLDTPQTYVTSPISSISFNLCAASVVSGFLAILIAPLLKKLALRYPYMDSDTSSCRPQASDILGLLQRSRCSLSHLALNISSETDMDALGELLESDMVRDVIDLEYRIPCISAIKPALAILEERTDLLPHLRVLSLTGIPDTESQDGMMQALQQLRQVRRPTLHELWIACDDLYAENWEEILTRLRDGGMDVQTLIGGDSCFEYQW